MKLTDYHSIAKGAIERALSSSFNAHDVKSDEYWNDKVEHEQRHEGLLPTGFAKLDQLVVASGARIIHGGSEAANRIEDTPSLREHRDQINNVNHFIELPMPEEFAAPDKYAAVLSHEMIHWATIRDPNAPLTGMNEIDNLMADLFHFMPEGYMADEIVAEVGSILLMQWADVPVPELTYPRIAMMISMIREERREVILRESTEKAVREFLNLMQHAGIDATA